MEKMEDKIREMARAYTGKGEDQRILVQNLLPLMKEMGMILGGEDMQPVVTHIAINRPGTNS